jgi:hypothetical protein
MCFLAWLHDTRASFFRFYSYMPRIDYRRPKERERENEREEREFLVCEQRAKYENESKRGSLHAKVEIKWPCSQPADSFFCPCARKLDNVREREGRNGALNGQRRRPLPAGPVQEKKCFTIFVAI